MSRRAGSGHPNAQRAILRRSFTVSESGSPVREGQDSLVPLHPDTSQHHEVDSPPLERRLFEGSLPQRSQDASHCFRKPSVKATRGNERDAGTNGAQKRSFSRDSQSRFSLEEVRNHLRLATLADIRQGDGGRDVSPPVPGQFTKPAKRANSTSRSALSREMHGVVDVSYACSRSLISLHTC